MKTRLNIIGLTTLFLVTAQPLFAQEEESAELFLEAYTDEFEEKFFEALKQKSIQNYDRAINLFFACKELDPLNDVIDYQLAKTYYLDKQYVQAQEYAIEALNSNPEDFWYLENLVTILEGQNRPIESINDRIPKDNSLLKQNLALVFFKKSKYSEAMAVLESMEHSRFVEDLSSKIKDSMQLASKRTNTPTKRQNTVQNTDPLSSIKSEMEDAMGKSDYTLLEELASNALETYPLQAYFHFAYGNALNGKGDTGKSIEVLEGALDYLFDDDVLANRIYKELAEAYKTIGNTAKANEYLNKIKPGL
ncbi:hypothetical protein M3P19_09880 [Muricauda sp. 2012CJ35-5]|uniref:Tetratricopeptide repeat protein n=1 Tax=Flagellimonas spongiicola TaxID=2942208 RepID=A0ABT0PSF5_9FLAO|nr:hypothetical protein [Allomuricauda spongiicola]MCL6274319.1 hypothetical protein [Allomuricauda spongiicola]